jgi:hypothetical protein
MDPLTIEIKFKNRKQLNWIGILTLIELHLETLLYYKLFIFVNLPSNSIQMKLVFT